MKVRVKLLKEETRILDIERMRFKVGDRLTLVDLYTDRSESVSLLRVAIKEKKALEFCKELCKSSFVDLEIYAPYIEYSQEYYRAEFISRSTAQTLCEELTWKPDMSALMADLGGCSDTSWAEEKMYEADSEDQIADGVSSGGFEETE